MRLSGKVLTDSSMKTLVLDQSTLQTLVRRVGIDALMDELITRIRTAFEQFDGEATVIPERTGFHYQSPTGLIEWMPLHERGDSVLMKMVGYHPTNPAVSALPTIVSTMSTFDTNTGHLQAIVDATFMTAMRTGAASCVASELLAARSSTTLGLIGCGAQSVTQFHAISRRFDLQEVLLFDVDSRAALSFSSRVSQFADVSCQVVSLEEIASRSDIICTATSVEVGEGPVAEIANCRPHLHVNAVGSDFPSTLR